MLTELAMQWQPKPSYPETEAFVRECQIVPSGYDIMGMRGTYHSARVLQLVDRFRAWRKERPSGIRAFQSTYDRYVKSLSRQDDRIDLSFSQHKSWNDSVQVAVPVTSWHPCHLCFWLHITFDGEEIPRLSICLKLIVSISPKSSDSRNVCAHSVTRAKLDVL